MNKTELQEKFLRSRMAFCVFNIFLGFLAFKGFSLFLIHNHYLLFFLYYVQFKFILDSLKIMFASKIEFKIDFRRSSL